MGEKCNPSYKNLNTIQSYSEQKYATVQWCQQNCENDEWLRQQVEQLRYLSPPAVRKRFDISKFYDSKQSYSCRANGKKQVVFDNTTIDTRFIDFTDIPNQVDEANTTAVPYNYSVEQVEDENGVLQVDSEGNPVYENNKTSAKQTGYRLPNSVDTYTTQPVYKTFGTAYEGCQINSYWYVGWDKDKPYYLRPDWYDNWKDGEIKAVSRCQTFEAEYTGNLESVSLALSWSGSQISNCGSPLYVQLWNTYKDWVEKSEWDNDKKQMKYKYINYANLSNEQKEIYKNKKKYKSYTVKVKYKSGKKKGQVIKEKRNGKWVDKTEKKWKVDNTNGTHVRKLEKVYKPGHTWWDSKKKKYRYDRYHPLAEAVLKKGEDTPPFPNIKFKTPFKIEKGKHYALVVSSPLSEWKHCPFWGGWGRNCKNDKKYDKGHAFISKNNTMTWSIYGKDGVDTNPNGTNLEYKKGKYTPQDFAFQCHVETKSAETTSSINYSTDKHELYLKPIYSNPIKSVEIDSECEGTEQSDTTTTIEFEVSTDGVEWVPIVNNGNALNFEAPYPRVLLVRAVMYRDPSDAYKDKTPFIENIKVTMITDVPKEMYVRTNFYTPRTAPMLGANLWGRVYAPFTTEETVDCKVEIIQGQEMTELFHIVDLDNLDEKINQLLYDDDLTNDSIINALAETEVSINNILSNVGEARATALTTNYQIIDVLKKYNIYILPYTSPNGLKRYLLSFSKSYDTEDMIVYRSALVEGSDDIQNTVDFDYEVGGVQFKTNVAYPLISFNGQPEAMEKGASVDSYTEGIDYTFDYEENALYLNRNTLDNLVNETWEIKYNKVFVGGLTNEELGKHFDEDTGLRSDGLILDYFQEKIPITNDHVTSRRVRLRAEPTDPIRMVRIYKKDNEVDEPVELDEEYDFVLDIESNELVFEVNNVDGVSTVLSEGDVLEVVYTPFLTDESLALGYYATRTNTDKQCYIDNFYFEYKA